PPLPLNLTDHVHAKSQTLIGIDDQDNTIVGDVNTMTDQTVGGNDALTGGNSTGAGTTIVFNDLIGDAELNMSGSAKGGNDYLIGGNNSGPNGVHNALFGDAGLNMSDWALGGNDTLVGGDNSGTVGAFNQLIGDADVMTNSAQGGND